MQVTDERELGKPRGHLGGAEQRADGHDRAGVEPEPAEDREHMGGKAGGHEGISGERRSDEGEGRAARRHHRRGSRRPGEVCTWGRAVPRGSAKARSGAATSANRAA